MRPFLLTWLCTSLSAGLPRWSLLLSYHSRASSTSGTDSSAAYPWSFSRSLSLKLAGSRSATCYLPTELLSARGLDLAASHRLGHLCFSWHVWSRCSVLRDLDLFLKLRHFEEFPGCPHFTYDNSRVELEMQFLRLLFALQSLAPCATERQCLYPKAEFQSCK